MNEQLQEQIKVVAEYDGWSRREYQPVHGRELYENDHKQQWLDSMQYHTSFDALMPVVFKIKNDLASSMVVNKTMAGWSDYFLAINSALLTDNYETALVELFASVVSGIQYLNTLKEKS